MAGAHQRQRGRRWETGRVGAARRGDRAQSSAGGRRGAQRERAVRAWHARRSRASVCHQRHAGWVGSSVQLLTQGLTWPSSVWTGGSYTKGWEGGVGACSSRARRLRASKCHERHAWWRVAPCSGSFKVDPRHLLGGRGEAAGKAGAGRRRSVQQPTFANASCVYRSHSLRASGEVDGEHSCSNSAVTGGWRCTASRVLIACMSMRA